MSRRRKQFIFPGWLWFFVTIPLSLIVLILYRRKKLPAAERLLAPVRRRMPYREPDSIPLIMHRQSEPVIETGPYDYEYEGEAEVGADAEDAAGAAVAAAAAERGAPQEPDAPVEQEIPAAQGTSDDLKIIEGIGPSIAGLLVDRGIISFRQLAGTPVETLDEILTTARLRRLADPATWPEQARLAADGKWDELKTLQGSLKAGRRVKKE